MLLSDAQRVAIRKAQLVLEAAVETVNGLGVVSTTFPSPPYHFPHSPIVSNNPSDRTQALRSFPTLSGSLPQPSSAVWLSLSDLSAHTSDTALTDDPAIDSNPLLGAKSAFDYDPPAARHFTDAEIAAKANCLNQKSRVNALIDHPLGAIVEYPETGAHPDERVAHRFQVDPVKFRHPKADFQYSLGDKHGGHKDVHCFLLWDTNGNDVLCDHVQTSCKGLKICSQCPHSTSHIQHSFVSRKTLPASTTLSAPSSSHAEEEVFMKTLGFACALKDRGCAFEADDDTIDADLEVDDEDDGGGSDEKDFGEFVVYDARTRRPARDLHCRGQIILRGNKFGRSYVQCEHYEPRTRRAHLVLQNLDEYNIPYLAALLADDPVHIREHEQGALEQGYGPLMACSFMASPSEQKAYCSNWHRNSDGELQQGVLRRWSNSCPTIYDIYVPQDLHACPQVVVVSRHPHSHPPPLPVKTPGAFVELFKSLLLELDWKLADATPRRILLDSAFMAGLRRKMEWTGRRDPVLSDLHPSLGNLDHVRRYINALRAEHFPAGTGFEGARLLVHEHENLPPDEQYVRCAEKQVDSGGKEFSFVICMLRAMSLQLMTARRLSIDTSFKRLHGWEEFEIETWDSNSKRSVIGVRAFTTSQSADAHFALIKRIFEIASTDTSRPVQFLHIHGEGFEAWVADAHKGQALGVGRYCKYLARDLTTYSPRDPSRLLRNLTPYDHLKQFYRVCVTHFKRNVHELRGIVSNDVQAAMLSIASSEPHVDLEGTFAVIRNGGKKAKAWLRDKLETNKFVLPALYHPASLIPLAIWKGITLSTNSAEQQHHNIYRDGVNLTILAGIIRGMQYDWRAIASIDIYHTTGIHHRDQPATYLFRITRSIKRHGERICFFESVKKNSQ
ncbi:hypothetical protein HWV62_26919 [Athelia sp. TMB]|nr:hypothetical protein HWV62_26919 [Athelia sp. TMB]